VEEEFCAEGEDGFEGGEDGGLGEVAEDGG